MGEDGNGAWVSPFLCGLLLRGGLLPRQTWTCVPLVHMAPGEGTRGQVSETDAPRRAREALSDLDDACGPC